jgi:hypothetical protein
VASDKAAYQALHWLLANKHIDIFGNPIYAREVLENLRSSLDQPITASITENTMKRMDKIWNDYENEISKY